MTYVTRDENVVKFSKPLNYPVTLTASYYGYGELAMYVARAYHFVLLISITLLIKGLRSIHMQGADLYF